MAEFDLSTAKPVFDLQGALSQTDKALGLPDGFSAAQIKVESGFDPSAVSKRGAMGLAQVMPDTLKVLSQRFGRDLDPMNPADAVAIHREVMRENLAKFKDPAKALMAYNGGWDPAKWANPETQAYVGKVSAAFKGEQNPVAAAVARAVGAVVPSAQAAPAAGGFDLSTAKPVAFDLSTAKPVTAGPTAAERIAADPITQGARNFVNDTGPIERGVAAYGKAGADLVRGAGQWLGLVSRDDVAERRRLDAPLMATTAGKVGNIAGNLAPAAATALLPGANTLLGGAALGAVTGALQPSTSTAETGMNTLLGLGGGAVVPAAGAVYRTAKAAAEPFYEAGRQAIVGRALNRAAGQDAPAVAARLTEAAAPFVGPSQGAIPRTTMGELVPGSVPTVGQAAGNAGVAALERAATAANPEVTNAVSAVVQRQNEARSGLLRDLAGTDGEREFHAAARDATAEQLYGQARRAGVDPAAVTPEAQANIAAFAQRVPPDVMAYARRLAQISGEPMDNGTSVQGLHWVKKAIDGLIGQAQRSGDNAAVRAYTGLQQDLLTGLDNISPAYGAARREYAAMSRPINAMDTVQAIADRSVSPLTGNVQPAAFARSFSDATAARATGMPRATLEGTLPPAQLNSLNFLLEDLRRANAAQNVGRGAGSDTVQKLAYNGLMDQAGLAGTRTGLRVLSGIPIVGRIGSAAGEAYDRASVDLNRRLAEVMLDPGQAAQLMTRATPQELNQLLRLGQRTGSGLAIAAPASAHAAQQ